MSRSATVRSSVGDGMSLVELMIGSLVAIIVVGIVITYVITAARIDRSQEADLDTLDEFQFARAQLVKELRFGRSVSSPGTNTVDVWIDLDGSGGTGPDAPGEDVTWQIVGSELVRYEDGNSADARPWATDLDSGASELVLDGTKVMLVLAAQVDRGFTTSQRTLRGTVTVRNAS